ncbi:Crp/Fnr family transcriptional regulator [Afifella sp. IM 167]|uniref:Crp/Fnr family transcriptional regulator n=1 Tax=Afifella sp. IM 167 TaxID=2033586 RepID=UPI001CCF1BB6|nr:Crp/Fnr family transcriptional regulator [Afifella sp. IM 167]MBZ8134332.1 cyclic nucleotide-binding protein [Afifella sp. IM 167]
MLTSADLETALGSLLLSAAPREVAEAILERSSVRSCERGASLFTEGEPAEHIHIVLAGWVKLFRVTRSGAEAVVAVFTRGGSFGEAPAFQGEPYPVSGEAVTDCRLLAVRAGLLARMVDEHPELGRAMLAATYRHLHTLVAQIEQLKAQTGPQRVAEFLLELCPAGEGACVVTLPYEKTLIAGRLGMQPESLSRAFARLREAGVTISQDHAAIARVDLLRAYVEGDRALRLGQAE